MPKPSPKKPKPSEPVKAGHGDKFEETVRRMLATPPRPKASKAPSKKTKP